MKFENTRIFNFEGALRGMRNPMNSWDKSDSEFNGDCEQCDNDQCNKCYNGVIIGDNDMTLAKKLINAGSEHRKFLRQIMVSVDITAPLYYWKEFDTYKVGTTANSTSTMHKLSTTPITLDCFETDDFEGDLPIGIDLTDIGMLAKDNICSTVRYALYSRNSAAICIRALLPTTAYNFSVLFSKKTNGIRMLILTHPMATELITADKI